MKKLLILIFLFMATQPDANAQNVSIANKRNCTVKVKLAGTTTGPCGNYVVYLTVPAMSSAFYPAATIGSYSFPPVTASSAGVVWNYAEIRSGSTCCGAPALMGISGNAPCGSLYPGPTVCSTASGECIPTTMPCANWTYPVPNSNDITIACY